MTYWRRLITHAVTSLFSSPLRSALALLGIVIGSAAVIAMVNIGHNAKQAMLKQFEGMGAQSTTIDYQQGAETSVAALLDLRDHLYRSIPGLEIIAATSTGNGRLRHRGESAFASVVGATDELFAILDPRLRAGRLTADLDGDTPHAMLGWKLYQDFRQQGIYLGVGDIVVFDDTPVMLVGVLEDFPHNSFLSPTPINNSLIAPLESLRRLNQDTSRWRLTAVRAKGVDYELVQAQLGSELRRLLPQTRVRISSPEQLIENIEKQTRILTLTLGAIGGVSLLVGGIGVMNIMLVSVSERRREIGLRMAIGARVTDIKLQFLTEALILCLAGGCVGLLFGIATAFGATQYFGHPFELSMASVVLGVGVSTLVGLFFGYHPAAAAAKLDPVDTLYGD